MVDLEDSFSIERNAFRESRKERRGAVAAQSVEPPPSRFARRKSVSAERYDPEADEEDAEQLIVHPKSDEQRKRLNDAVKPIFLFRSLEPVSNRGNCKTPHKDHPEMKTTPSPFKKVLNYFLLQNKDHPNEQMHCVLDAMFEKRVNPGEHVIDQGDDGDNFYVIDSGTYDIYVDNKVVGKYDGRGSFGELALMYNMPRAATIIATSEGVVWAMDRLTFRRIVLKNAYEKRKVYESLLENVPMLKTLEVLHWSAYSTNCFHEVSGVCLLAHPGERMIGCKGMGEMLQILQPYERMNIADALFSKTFEDGEIIIKQGDSADCMYFIEEGDVKITVKNMNVPNSDEKEVKKCGKGGYFGELALLTHKPRAATVYAVGKTRLAVLDVQAFERLLGPCMDIMKRSIDEYEEQLISIFGSKADITDLR